MKRKLNERMGANLRHLSSGVVRLFVLLLLLFCRRQFSSSSGTEMRISGLFLSFVPSIPLAKEYVLFVLRSLA